MRNNDLPTVLCSLSALPTLGGGANSWVSNGVISQQDILGEGWELSKEAGGGGSRPPQGDLEKWAHLCGRPHGGRGHFCSWQPLAMASLGLAPSISGPLFHNGQRSGIGGDKSCGPTPDSRKWGPPGRLCGGVLERRKDLTGSSSAVSPDPKKGLGPWPQGLGPQDLPAMA